MREPKCCLSIPAQEFLVELCYNIHSTKDAVCSYKKDIWMLILGIHDFFFFLDIMAAFVTRTYPPPPTHLETQPKRLLVIPKCCMATGQETYLL